MILSCAGGSVASRPPEIEFECGGRSPRSRPALVAARNSANRPAAMTAIAVQKLARVDSVSIGFIGCGVQARSHFDVLRLVLPDLKEVVVCSRSAASAERFVAMVPADPPT